METTQIVLGILVGVALALSGYSAWQSKGNLLSVAVVLTDIALLLILFGFKL